MRLITAALVAAFVLSQAACSSSRKADPRGFCAASDRAGQLGNEIRATGTGNPDALKQRVHAAATAAESAAGRAPSEIRSEAGALADALGRFDKRVAAAADSEEMAAAFAAYKDAVRDLVRQSQTVERWVRAHCSGGASS